MTKKITIAVVIAVLVGSILISTKVFSKSKSGNSKGEEITLK